MPDLRIATTCGSETLLDQAAVQDLQARLRGPLLRSGDAGYDEARQIFNAMHDRHPALIARCTGAADVIATVSFARTHDLLVAVRGGDHSIAGHATCAGGLMIDLSLMADVRVDLARQTARAGGGTRWGHFDHETQAFGLATTGGTNSDTGIGGLTLGGGLGWLAGKYGLACDNLLSADVVTADCRLLTASATQNADLFWGLRGGSGNFGIVTSFEYQLHRVGTVLAGMAIHPMDRAREALAFYRDFSRAIPDEVNTIAVLLTMPEGNAVVGLAVCYNGPLEEGEKALRPLREFGPPVADQIAPMPYTALQSMIDGVFPRRRRYYWKARLISDICDDAIDTLIERYRTVPSPFTVVGFQQLGNAANRVGPDETAFSHREAIYDLLMLSGWEDAGETERNVRWTRELDGAMQPFCHGGLYVNAVSDEDAGPGVRAAYRPQTYERLVALKNQYDPSNFFRLNPNIEPTV